MALTDHGNMCGALHHIEACVEHDIVPISGMEAYFKSNRFLQDKDHRKSNHTTLWALSIKGWHSLLRLSSEAHDTGYYYRPCADWDLFERYNEGLAASTGCMAGPVPQAILAGDDKLVKEYCDKLDRIFDDRMYVELMPHDIDEQRVLNIELARIAQERGWPVLATTDAHYPRQDWAGTQDIMLMIATGQTLSKRRAAEEKGEDVYKFDLDTFYLMDRQTVEGLFEENHPELPKHIVQEACDQTVAFVDRIDQFTVDKSDKMPRVKLERPVKDEIVDWCERGMVRIGREDDKEYRDRLEYELSILESKEVLDYFYLVGDLVRWAKNEGVRVGAGRGSAAGCLVSYLIGITNVDPIAYGLLFERFLNPDRASMPDIDLDFQHDRRDEAKDYLADKWGKDHVVEIAAFQTFGLKSSIKDVARVLDIPLQVVMPVIAELDDQKSSVMLEDMRAMSERIKGYASKNPEAWEHAVRLQKKVKGQSKHPAGVVVTDKPATEYIPLMRSKNGYLTTQWSETMGFNAISEYGFLKVDILSTDGLTRQEICLRLIEERTGSRPDIDNLPIFSDPHAVDEEVMDAWRAGDTFGIFQFQSCLAGDTIINGGPRRTIAEMYESPPEKILSIDLGIGTRHRNDVLEIVQTGEKQLFRINTVSGRTIRATADHGFLTRDGWKSLKELDVCTDEVVINHADASRIGCCTKCGIQKRGHGAGRKCNSCANSVSRPLTPAGLAGVRRGIKNRIFTKEMRDALSKRMSGSGNPMYGRNCPHFNIGKGSRRRDDIPHRVRSTWEADYARYLMHEDIEYLYEPKRFELKSIGQTYLPDFYLVEEDKYVEIKGWWRPGCREKIDAFREEYPDIELMVIDAHVWAEFELQHRDLVPNWECPKLPPNHGFDQIASIERDCVEMTYDIKMKEPFNNYTANGFVVHNSGITRLIKQIKPTSVDDIVAANALYRPGPLQSGTAFAYGRRKNGEERVDYWHESVKPYMERTYGLLVYQEQVMKVVEQIGGFSPAESDTLRKAMTKWQGSKVGTGKGIVYIQRYREQFIKGAKERGIPKKEAEGMWEKLGKFTIYAFNASHSAGYGVQAYQDMWLKVKYPLEFYTALLATEKDDIPQIVREARGKGIPVLPPNINTSNVTFSVDGDSIRFGLAAIKNVGGVAVNEITKLRREDGPFRSYEDFCERIQARKCNSRVKQSLVDAGAFDEFNMRQGMSQDEIHAAEVEMMGMSISVSIVSDEDLELLDNLTDSADVLDEAQENTTVRVGGEVIAVQKKKTKMGREMASFQIAHRDSVTDVVVFPDSYSKYVREELKVGVLALVKGAKDDRGGVRMGAFTTLDNWVSQKLGEK